MQVFLIFSAVAMPIMMVVGVLASRSYLKDKDRSEREQNAWRDTSLDDWRKERDAAAEEERQARVDSGVGEQHAGSTEEQEETKRHQRIGG